MGLAEFSRLFGAMSFSKHSCLVKDKPVQEWLAIVNAANEAEEQALRNARSYQEISLRLRPEPNIG